MKRRWFFLLLLLIFVLFFALGLQDYLTLEFVKSNLLNLQKMYEDGPLRTVVLFALIYTLSVTLSFPGAAVLTLLAGAVFGVGVGTALVSVVSTVGATLAFLGTRWLAGDYVRRHWHDKWLEIEKGFEKEGPFYLLTLRLIPVFPFFLINILMGLTPIAWSRYMVISWLGMLPGTWAFVNAGQQLSRLTSLKGILTPEFIAAMVVLGLIPWIAKLIMAALRRHRLYSKFKRPRKFEYNLVVIGGGSGGLVTAYIASAVKAKVALIEKNKMGGDCLNTGCVPSKALLRTAQFIADVNQSKALGIKSAHVEIEFSQVMNRVHQVIEEIEPHDSVERYRGLGVDCIDGCAEIISPYEVKIGTRILTAKNIVIATGAAPRIPNIPGLDKISYLTSENLWSLKQLPKKLLVVGGGAMGCEMAQAFRLLGSQVILLEGGPRLLPKEDPEVSEFIQKKFGDEGLEILTQCKLLRFESTEGTRAIGSAGDRGAPEAAGPTVAIVQNAEGAERKLVVDSVLLASGRKSRLEGFGLEKIGVQISEGELALDGFLRTNFHNIYACGDVIGKYQFTHAASHEAWFVAVNALFSPFKKYRLHYKAFPWVTYTMPEIARVGLNEVEAQAKKMDFEVTRYDLSDLDRAITSSEAQGFVKIITPRGSDKILGVTIVGAHAGEMLGEFVLAMRWGLGLGKILSTVHPYPTMSEANKFAAGVWRKNHAPAIVLRCLDRFHQFRRHGL